MQSITNCPACQTQFVVTEEQLNQHNGQVRCGHCLHVFNATEQLVNFDFALENPDTEVNTSAAIEPVVVEQNLNDTDLVAAQEPIVQAVEPSDNSADHTPSSNFASFEIIDPVNETLINDAQPSKFDDLADKSKPNPKQTAKKSPSLLWFFFAVILLLAAIAQSIYFLRNQIALYYPNTKPMLVQACAQIGCNIDLPKKIELIVIDDSDIQEDTNYVGLMRLSSTLINQAGFNQAYPNLELTLTDTEDKPKLRRMFKPTEYLPAKTNIAIGLAPGEEIKVKLAMSTYGVTVAGYRVFVTY
jgi:predicted Zn finger-like uncharacterized protein